MYLLYTDDIGRIGQLRKSGEPVTIDDSSGEIKNFIAWAKTEFPEFNEHDLPPNVVIPFDRQTAFEIIKDARSRIAVVPSKISEGSYIGRFYQGTTDERLDRNERDWLRALYWISDKDQAPDLNVLSSCSGVCCSEIRIPKKLFEELQDELKGEPSCFRKLSDWPITRAFVYLDISDFSQVDALHQAVVIDSLISLIQEDHHWANCPEDWRAGCESKLCIGDGYIFVFDDAVSATWFAAHLADLIEYFVAHDALPVKFHFRMGVHVGEVYCFWDFGRDDWNYIGWNDDDQAARDWLSTESLEALSNAEETCAKAYRKFPLGANFATMKAVTQYTMQQFQPVNEVWGA